MKQFIYLNTDVVNSIIAQKEKSLMLELKKETEDSSGKSKEKTANASLSGSIEGGISLLAKASGELTGAVGFGNQSHSQSIFKEIESRTLHDAAFDIAYKQLNFETNLNAVEFGDFIELDRAFDIVDFEYLDRLFLKDGFIDFLKNTAKETVKKVTSEHIDNTTGREQRRKRGSEIKQTIKEMVSDSDRQFDDIVDIVKVLKSIIPYNKTLVTHDGFIIPLEDQYFRVNSKTLGFMYGGEMRCVGYVSNLIGVDTEPDSSNIFGTLQYMVNEVFRKILPTTENNLYVVHPIAVYYGK